MKCVLNGRHNGEFYTWFPNGYRVNSPSKFIKTHDVEEVGEGKLWCSDEGDQKLPLSEMVSADVVSCFRGSHGDGFNLS